MYKDILTDSLGKVVSVKTTAGIELIATLMGFDEKSLTLTLDKPRLVVVSEDSIAVVPYTFTSKSNEVFILREQYLSVDAALENSSTDYLKLLEDTDS
jgi:small nuclear ribonucleoprotein (snRNP)-like protein|tara:strand:+ start:2717 stop:3010 length:294 start_codon:yes stop_codon:yes gene_type:complete